MTTFSEEVSKAKTARNEALLAVRNIYSSEEKQIKRRDSLTPILFGDGELGVLEIYEPLYVVLSHASGLTTQSPDFTKDWKTQYLQNMILSVTNSGDGEQGLYPPDPSFPQKGSDEFNRESKWLKGFETVDTGVGVANLLDSTVSDIGEKASDNSNGRGPFSTEAAAEAERDKDRGSGYLGKRTENNDIYSLSSDSSTSYYVGQNGIDTPDDASFKTGLENSLNIIIDRIRTLNSSIEDAISVLESPSEILTEFEIVVPSTEFLNTFVQQNNDLITELSDLVTYLQNLSVSSSNREAINTFLEERKVRFSEIANSYRNYETEINSKVESMNPSLVYWVEEIVKKPSGCLSILGGVEPLLQKSKEELVYVNDRLSLLSSNREEWMLKPYIIGVFNQAILNLDRTIKRWDTNILWSNNLPSNKFKFKALPASALSTIDNSQWDFSDADEIIELNEAGFLTTQKTITPPEEHTFFRVQNCEELTNWAFPPSDSQPSYSLQSDIISEEIPFTILEDFEGASVIEIQAEEISKVNLRVSDFLLLTDKIAQVKNISETIIQLDTKYEINNVKKLFGFYYFTEL